MRRRTALASAWIFVIAACTGGGPQPPAGPDPILGAWTVKNVGPFAGSIMSFRNEGTMRILMTVPPEQLEQLQQLPAGEQAKQSRNLVVRDGATYFNVSGTWTREDADKIKTLITISSGDKKPVIYTVRQVDAHNMELQEPGMPATLLQYVSEPLPAS